ncbi:MAG: LysM domain-containing protein [Chloroflexi bacterium]|nr:MAG: LysM domain-containing protein [Chloroflexota bacterium]
MKKRILILIILGLLVVTATVSAQTTPVSPTPGALTILPTATIDPFPTQAPPDSRLDFCRAPVLNGFAPYFVRPGDRLADLLRSRDNLTITQIASLNCLDDPNSLPVGAVIWLPESAIISSSGEVSSTQTAAPRIIALTADDETIANQVGTTIRWEATGEAAYFYSCPADANAPCTRPPFAPSVGLTDAVTVRDFQYAGPARFRLEVVAGDEAVTQDITLNVVCAQQWLAPLNGTLCPQEAARAIFGAWQAFENGVMFWFSDSDQIWVMTADDHRVRIFNDIYESQPDPDDIPPDGLFTPTMGFGQIWLLLGGADSDIGWGIVPSRGLDILRQRAGRVSFTTYIQGPDAIVYAVTIVPGTDIALWQQVTESS